MNLPTQPPQPPTVMTFWTSVGRLFAQLLAKRAHADIIISVMDGKVKLVRVDQRYLPTDIPQG